MGKKLIPYLKEPVSRFAKRDYVILDSSKFVTDATKIMVEKGIDSVLVSKDNKPIGIVTVRDVIVRVVAKGYDPSKVKLENVMSTPLIKIGQNAKVEEAIAMMCRKNIRRLVVVNEKDEIIGIITQMSIVGDISGNKVPIAYLEAPKGVICPFCGSRFKTKEELYKHIDRVHIGAGLLEGDIRQW